MPVISGDYITTKEAAELLGLHVKYIPSLIKNNTLEGIRFGRDWLVSRSAVDEYIKQTKDKGKRDMRYKNKRPKKK
jgi:excisionase family DNA binding protein